MGLSWERLGASWGRLGRVLGRPGRVLGRLGGVLAASWAPKPPQDKSASPEIWRIRHHPPSNFPLSKDNILRSQTKYNVPRRDVSQRRFPSSASRPMRCSRPPSPSQTLPLPKGNLSCGATLITTFRARIGASRHPPASGRLPMSRLPPLHPPLVTKKKVR